MSDDRYQAVEDAFRDGTIDARDSGTLRQYLLVLSNQPIRNDMVRHRDIIRGLTLNHILLQRHTDGLNKQNGRLQWLVVALTIASLLGTVAQVWYAQKAADAEARAPAQQSSLAPSTAPSAPQRPAGSK
jgi:hypothetical protein